MGKVLIIGAGGVGTVVAHKVAQNPDVFTEIMIASRTKSKCDAVVKAIGNPNIQTAQVDADNVDELVALFNSFKPEIVINVALPYQDLTIMEACLKTGVNYLDTANYEPKDVAHFEYSWQWAYKKRFEDVVSTRVSVVSIQPMQPSIISTKYSIWTLSIATPVITIKLLRLTSIPKSTSAKSHRTDVIMKTASG